MIEREQTGGKLHIDTCLMTGGRFLSAIYRRPAPWSLFVPYSSEEATTEKTSLCITGLVVSFLVLIFLGLFTFIILPCCVAYPRYTAGVEVQSGRCKVAASFHSVVSCRAVLCNAL